MRRPLVFALVLALSATGAWADRWDDCAHFPGEIATRLADAGGKTPLETYKAPSRANTRPLTTHQDEAAIKALKRISAETGRTMQSLLASGINHVLVQHGQPPLADETKRR